MEPLGAIDQLIRKVTPHGSTICFTSVSPDSGVRYMALSMAERLVALGNKCLILELDADLPKLGLITGAMGQSWHEQIDEIFDSITTLPNKLDVFAPMSAPPAVCRTSAWLRNLIERAGNEYDFVIMTAAPVLADHLSSPRPAMVAEIAELSLLVTVARRDVQAALVNATEILTPAGQRLAGVVINDFENPTLADSLLEASEPYLRKRPLLQKRIARWLKSVSIFNIDY